jgi:sugar lactone lactonase YvrE
MTRVGPLLIVGIVAFAVVVSSLVVTVDGRTLPSNDGVAHANLSTLAHAALTPLPNPYSTGLAASLVLGQASLTANASGVTATELGRGGWSIAFAPGGALWATDLSNNRVLEYLPPFTDGEAASVVLGQATFTTNAAATSAGGESGPTALAFDAHGDLWVADYSNNRVVEYVPPFTDGMSAGLVIGQTGFTTATSGTTSSTLSGPRGLAFDAKGDLWVADHVNNRVLEFLPPFTTGMSASLVLGQKTFTTLATGTNQSSLQGPDGLAFGPSGELWVSDQVNDRALGFLPPFSDGMPAKVVLGETDFNSTTEAVPYGLYSPRVITLDAFGDVWLADSGVSRVQEYVPGFSINQPQAIVLGQSNFFNMACENGTAGLCGPTGVAVDGQGHVWVLDASNARIVEYVPHAYAWTFSETGLASGTKWSVTVDGSSYSSTAATIVVNVPNGTHSFSIGSVSGYSESPGSGSGAVNASAISTLVAFSPTILGLTPGTFAFLVVDIVLIAGGAAAIILLRRRGRRPASPPPLKPSPPVSSPPSAAPPPGAGGPPGPSS